MTSHVGRLYALAFALVVFFLAWVVVAAHPWATAAADSRQALLARREAQLRQEAKLVHQVVAERWAAYRTALKLRRTEIAAARTRASHLPASPSGTGISTAPSVRVVTLPPLTITRTS